MHVIMRLNDNCLEIFPTLGFSGQSVQKALEADSPSQSLSCCWSVGCFDHHPACQLSQIHVLTSCGLGRAWHRGDSIPPFHDKLIILPPEIVPPNALRYLSGHPLGTENEPPESGWVGIRSLPPRRGGTERELLSLQGFPRRLRRGLLHINPQSAKRGRLILNVEFEVFSFFSVNACLRR